MKSTLLIFTLATLGIHYIINSQKEQVYNKTTSIESSYNPEIEEINMLDVFHSNNNLAFESVELISLETLPDVLIGEFNQLVINIDKDIYVSNAGNQPEIFRFNKQGKFLNSIGNQGNGPKEFQSIEDICIHGDTVDVLCKMGNKVKIVGYKNDDTFLYSKSINLVAYSFEWMSPGYILETSYSPVYPFRVYMTDENGKIIDSFLPNTTGFPMASAEKNFSRIGSKVFCKESLNNEVYIAEGHKLSPAYNINLGSFKVPKEYFKSDPMQAYQLLQGRAVALIRKYFETPSNAFFHIRQKPKSTSGVKDLIDHIVVLDKNTKKIMKRSFKVQSEDLFKNPVSGTLNDEIVFLIYPYMIFSDRQAFNLLPIKNAGIIDRLKVDDNPILAICK